MCNLGEGIAEEAREEGREEGREEQTLVHLRNIIKKTKMTLEQAMDMLEVPIDSRPMYASMIR